MIEVLSSFECTSNTFFVAVDMMDTYLALAEETFEPKKIHLIGVTSMLLASKIEEITPFKVTLVVEKVAHGKVSAKEIVRCETEIITTLNFKVMNNSSLYVFIEMILVRLQFHASPMWKDILKVVTYITKMTMHDYEILTKYPLEYLACGCVYLCFKIIEQANETFSVRSYLEEMKKIFCLEEFTFYNASEDLLRLAKGFEKEYAFAKNLLKYDAFSLEKTQ